MDKENKIFLLAILVLFIGIMIYVSYNKSRLNKEGVIVSVRIIDYNYGVKSVNTLTCEFIYKGKKHYISTGSSVPLLKWGKLKGSIFPGMYSPRSGMLKVLILPDDFEEFNISYPDSLAKWVQGHLIND